MKEKRRGENGIITLLGSVMLFLLVLPLLGLAIDVGVMFMIKSKLQAAVDGAALAAARGLSQELDLASQQGAARDVAGRWLRANFPAGWMGVSPIPNPVVTFPPAPPRTIIVNVTASLDAPTWFMKILGFDRITVRGLGEATRRFVNIAMVIDRSGSLYQSGSCGAVQQAATAFIQSFVNGQDRLGLITFGTNYRVDFPMSYNFASGSPNMATMMGQLYCYGYTNAAAAYWTGYQQLVNLNDQGALNVILFFTDGMPNTLTFGMASDGTDNRLPQKTLTTPQTYTDPYGFGYSNADKSRCKDSSGRTSTNAAWNPTPLTGVLGPIGGVYMKDAAAYPASAAVDAVRIGEAEGNHANACAFNAYFNSNRVIGTGGSPSRALAGPGFTAMFDVAYVPEEDIFRNRTGAGYGGAAPYVSVQRYPSTWPASYRDRIRIDNLAICGSGCTLAVNDNIARAGMNALDYAAQRARADSAARNLHVYTYAIGLGNGAGGVDDELLRRVANDPTAGNFNPALPEGKYVATPTAAQLNQAFTEIASSVLRLTK